MANDNASSRDRRIPLWLFALIYSVMYWLVADVAEFVDQPLDGWGDALYMAGYFGVVALMQAALIGLLSLNRYVFAILSPLLLLSAAVLTYFFVTLHTTLSPTIVGLALTNDIATSSDLVTWPLALTIAVSLMVSAGFIYARFRLVEEPRRCQSLVAAAALALFLCVTLAVGKLRTVAEQRQPFIIHASARDYLRLRSDILTERHTYDEVESTAGSDTVTVVLVLGESLRSDHLGLNGYGRNTTPLLGGTTGLVSYPNLTTEAFHTAISIPRLMTRADDDNPEPGYEEQSFITLFKKAGFNTLWIANQEPLKSFAYFVEEADSVARTYLGHSHYNYDNWLDGETLDPLDSFLLTPAPRKLAVIHTIGSHWWYNTHYDERHALFKPELTSRNINANSLEQMVNSYDNCVLYTDWYLSEVIGRLTDDNAVMIYISDHGEGLGEGGNLLHGQPSEGTEKAALIFWMSDRYRQTHPEVYANINANKDRSVHSDLLFHTILDCADITTSAADTLKSVARQVE